MTVLLDSVSIVQIATWLPLISLSRWREVSRFLASSIDTLQWFTRQRRKLKKCRTRKQEYWLLHAARNNDVELLQFALRNGAAGTEDALWIATKHASIEVIDVLRGIGRNWKETYDMHRFAIRSRSPALLERVLRESTWNDGEDDGRTDEEMFALFKHAMKYPQAEKYAEILIKQVQNLFAHSVIGEQLMIAGIRYKSEKLKAMAREFEAPEESDEYFIAHCLAGDFPDDVGNDGVERARQKIRKLRSPTIDYRPVLDHLRGFDCDIEESELVAVKLYGAPVDRVTEYNRNGYLTAAIEGGHVELIKSCVAAGSTIDYNDITTFLHKPRVRNPAEVMEALLVTKTPVKAIIDFAWNSVHKNKKILRLLMRYWSEISEDVRTKILIGCRWKHLKIVYEYMISKRCKIDWRYAVYCACHVDSPIALEFVWQHAKKEEFNALALQARAIVSTSATYSGYNVISWLNQHINHDFDLVRLFSSHAEGEEDQ